MRGGGGGSGGGGEGCGDGGGDGEEEGRRGRCRRGWGEEEAAERRRAAAAAMAMAACRVRSPVPRAVEGSRWRRVAAVARLRRRGGRARVGASPRRVVREARQGHTLSSPLSLSTSPFWLCSFSALIFDL